jgi:hypothetical protein
VKTHRDLDVWKEGIDLAISIYKVAEEFPKEEKYSAYNLRKAWLYR